MLYRHVPNKAAVLDGVAEIVLSQLAVDSADPEWVNQLRLVAHDFRRLALAHPNVVPLLVTRPLATPLGQRPPGTLRPLEDVLTLLTSAGFSGADALHIYRVLFGLSARPHPRRAARDRRTPRGNRPRTAPGTASTADHRIPPAAQLAPVLASLRRGRRTRPRPRPPLRRPDRDPQPLRAVPERRPRRAEQVRMTELNESGDGLVHKESSELPSSRSLARHRCLYGCQSDAEGIPHSCP